MGKLTGDLDGLAPGFKGQLDRAAAAAPGDINVTSGYRTSAEQRRLYEQKKNIRVGGKRIVALPGSSKHEKGLAADVAGSVATMSWLHRNARSFGLYFPMSWEPWHIQPIDEGAAGVGGDGALLGDIGGGDFGGSAGGTSNAPLVPAGTAKRAGLFAVGAVLVVAGFAAIAGQSAGQLVEAVTT